MVASIPDPAFEQTHFTLDNLIQIVAIGETRAADDIDITLLSLECYHDGFAALVLAESSAAAPVVSTAWPPEPPRLLRSTLVVTDVRTDTGQRYTCRPRAGHGGGRPDGRIEVRSVFACAPALDGHARSLTLTVEQVEHVSYTLDGAAAWNESQVLGGPWSLTFNLP